MTVQAKDRIIIEDTDYPMSSTPFNVYLKSNNLAIKRKRLTTGNNRGHIGKWQIIGKDLFLVGLKKDPEDDQPISVNTFFPSEDRVIADWYTGMLEVKTGKEIGYCHYRGELYDKELRIKVKSGKVRKIMEIEPDNSTDIFKRKKKFLFWR